MNLKKGNEISNHRINKVNDKDINESIVQFHLVSMVNSGF